MSRTITVKGTGRLHLAPDLTVVTMTLKTLNKKKKKSMKASADQLERRRSALCAVGFGTDDLKTTLFNVCAEHEGRSDKNGTFRNCFVGYACIPGLRLEFPFDTDRIARVNVTVAGCVAEPELNIRFTVKDRESACDALLKSAAENARHKARVLADASGVRLGQLLSVTYDWADLDLYARTDRGSVRCCAAAAHLRITCDKYRNLSVRL